MNRFCSVLLVGAMGAAGLGTPAFAAEEHVDWTATTHRGNVAADGSEANSYSSFPRLSADGRYVAFASTASNLVPGDVEGTLDVFRRDLRTGRTVLVSTPAPGHGAERYGASDWPTISGDGRYVAFYSNASNLVPGDTNGANDIFVRDLRTGTTSRVSVSSAGAEANGWNWDPAISGNGRYVAYVSEASNLAPDDANSGYDIFVHDRWTTITRRVSAGAAGVAPDGMSFHAAISGDGRYVAFASEASNLVPDDTNAIMDVFVCDLRTGARRRASVPQGAGQADGGSQRPSLSHDGRYVAFQSEASTLVPGDTNGMTDVFVRDMRAGRIARVSVAGSGTEANAFSDFGSISGNGRYVAFVSPASNLVSEDTNGMYDIFVRDLRRHSTVRVSVSSNGEQANGYSFNPHLTAGGGRVAFQSWASNLVAGDTNATADVFVRDRRG